MLRTTIITIRIGRSMALKATIYKANIQLSDIDRGYFEPLSLTLAQHPSETLERLAARLLAFCLNASDSLAFTKGLSTTEEPDLWERSLTGDITHWIEVGQPEPERIKYALKRTQKVTVYAFGKSASTWWELNGEAFAALNPHQIWQFEWSDMQRIAAAIDRSFSGSVTITEGIIYLSLDELELQLQPALLRS